MISASRQELDELNHASLNVSQAARDGVVAIRSAMHFDKLHRKKGTTLNNNEDQRKTRALLLLSQAQKGLVTLTITNKTIDTLTLAEQLIETSLKLPKGVEQNLIETTDSRANLEFLWNLGENSINTDNIPVLGTESECLAALTAIAATKFLHRQSSQITREDLYRTKHHEPGQEEPLLIPKNQTYGLATFETLREHGLQRDPFCTDLGNIEIFPTIWNIPSIQNTIFELAAAKQALFKLPDSLRNTYGTLAYTNAIIPPLRAAHLLAGMCHEVEELRTQMRIPQQSRIPDTKLAPPPLRFPPVN